jgi:opine dehydrogenase
MAVGDVFRTKMRSIYEQDKEWYGCQGTVGKNIYETTVNNSIYQWSKAPDSFQHRYLTEDIPYGLDAIEDMGKKAGVPTPITTSMINIAQVLVGRDLREERRSLEKLGLAQKSVDEIIRFVNEGE